MSDDNQCGHGQRYLPSIIVASWGFLVLLFLLLALAVGALR